MKPYKHYSIYRKPQGWKVGIPRKRYASFSLHGQLVVLKNKIVKEATITRISKDGIHGKCDGMSVLRTGPYWTI